jgi:hypothetical protein
MLVVGVRRGQPNLPAQHAKPKLMAHHANLKLVVGKR